MFVAICRIHGIPARSVWIPGHTYPEFCLAPPKGEPVWYACQAAGIDSFGHVTDPRPILQKGDSFRVPGGGREPIRYVAPVLQALDVGRGAPALTMITEPVATDASAATETEDPATTAPTEAGRKTMPAEPRPASRLPKVPPR